jgi:foldase protein PrsA
VRSLIHGVSITLFAGILILGCTLQAHPTALPAAGATSNTVTPAAKNRSATPSATVDRPTAATTSQPAGALGEDVVASVNGQAIGADDFYQQAAQARSMYIDQAGLDPNSEAAVQLESQLNHQVRDGMIDQVLLQQFALANSIRVTDAQVDAEITRMKGQDSARFEQWLQANGLSEVSLRQRLSRELLASAVRDVVTARLERQQVHIHVRYIITTDQTRAQEALAKLHDGVDFKDVANQYSQDETTRTGGGDLGFFPHGVMPPAFDQAAFALTPNRVSDIVPVEWGFLIIEVLEVDPARTVSDEYWPLAQQYAFETWLASQRAQAKIELNPAFD